MQFPVSKYDFVNFQGGLKMQNKLAFFPDEDIIHFSISDEEETDSIELSPNITAELNKKGEIIGLEILKATSYIRDVILDSAQAKLWKKKTSTTKISHIRPKAKIHARQRSTC
jgi:uncharacterized protein YuzE